MCQKLIFFFLVTQGVSTDQKLLSCESEKMFKKCYESEKLLCTFAFLSFLKIV